MRALYGLLLALMLFFGAAQSASAWSEWEASQANQHNYRLIMTPAYNVVTHTYEERRGKAVMTKYGKIWCSLPLYEGPGYVIIPTMIGPTFVQIDKFRYLDIYADLTSGVDERIEGAYALVEGSAMMQGLMDLELSGGE